MCHGLEKRYVGNLAVVPSIRLTMTAVPSKDVSASCRARSESLSAGLSPNNCPLTPTTLDSSTTYTNHIAWLSNSFGRASDNMTLESPHPPKHRVAGSRYGCQQIGKKAMTIPTLAQCSPFSPATLSDSIDDVPSWDDAALLTSAQYSTIALNRALNCQDDHEMNMGVHQTPAPRSAENSKQIYGNLWRPEVKTDGGYSEYNNFTEAVDSESPFPCSTLTGAPTHEDLRYSVRSTAPTQTDSVTSDSSDLATTSADADRTKYLLAFMFPPLPPHVDPPSIISKKIAIAPDDLYSPLYVRNEGTKNREGWCGYCQRWLPLRESSYNYDKKYTHGICPSTGRPFETPVEIKTSFGRRNGKVNTKVARCEGLCGKCGEWIRLGGRSGPANSWWRHAFQVTLSLIITCLAFGLSLWVCGMVY